jgi:pimeloyl-ACP methyl ester carboxylesterase
LLTRARRLTLASQAVAQADLPMTGVGHSIGAAVLLALAGGHLWMRPGRPLPIAPLARIDRLALLAPATGFFQPPGALDEVRAPLAVWAGERDTVTPPEQAEFLARSLADRVSVDLRIVEGAGHFTFMNVLPPHITDPLPDRLSVLERIQADVVRFATA